MKRPSAPRRLAACLVAVAAALSVFVSLAGASGPTPPLFTMIDLGSLGGSYSAAQAISNNGQVVGESNAHAFYWTQATGMMDLGTLGGRSSALGVNDGGQVFGLYYTATGYTRVFSWNQTSGMIDLGTLGGSSTTANGMNASGQIVGYSNTAGNTASHAFSWTPGRAGWSTSVRSAAEALPWG